jgi:hypothetical protein
MSKSKDPNNATNCNNKTTITLYRSGDRDGRWWSVSKDFADCFGSEKGKETIRKEFTFQNVLDISFRSSIDYMTIAELGKISMIPVKEILKELDESGDESTLVDNENDLVRIHYLIETAPIINIIKRYKFDVVKSKEGLKKIDDYVDTYFLLTH